MYKKIIPAVVFAAAVMMLYKPADKSLLQPQPETNTPANMASTKSLVSQSASAPTPQAQITEVAPDLNQKIEYFFNEIPKITSLRHATAHEVHSMPAQVRDAGQYLAEMRDFFVKYPQSTAAEMNFYMKCATDADLFDSVRAICAARTGEKYKQLTGRQISPLVFGKRIGDLQRYVKL